MTREGGKRNPPKGIVMESLSFSMFGMLQVKTMPWFSRAVDGNAFGVTSSLEESFENLFPNNASSRQIVILWQRPSYLKLVTLEGLVRESGSILLSCLLCPKCKGVDGISVLEDETESYRALMILHCPTICLYPGSPHPPLAHWPLIQVSRARASQRHLSYQCWFGSHIARYPAKKVIFKATYWLRLWAQLQKCEEDGEFMSVACRNLESTVMQLFTNHGWRFTNRLE
uniref:Uncharacterized protein n=1 Tax=Oryza sativa subsp. japonica TaxID=39947 RepID=Q6ZK04_ORYSJ|nr:hypothetical protein [Oryza sativa Japonica Group]